MALFWIVLGVVDILLLLCSLFADGLLIVGWYCGFVVLWFVFFLVGWVSLCFILLLV